MLPIASLQMNQNTIHFIMIMKSCFACKICVLLVWRQDELTLINKNTTGAARKAALCGLLEQEAQLIASVGRHKIVANVENKDKKIKSFLDAVSS